MYLHLSLSLYIYIYNSVRLVALRHCLVVPDLGRDQVALAAAARRHAFVGLFVYFPFLIIIFVFVLSLLYLC